MGEEGKLLGAERGRQHSGSRPEAVGWVRKQERISSRHGGAGGVLRGLPGLMVMILMVLKAETASPSLPCGLLRLLVWSSRLHVQSPSPLSL